MGVDFSHYPQTFLNEISWQGPLPQSWSPFPVYTPKFKLCWKKKCAFPAGFSWQELSPAPLTIHPTCDCSQKNPTSHMDFGAHPGQPLYSPNPPKSTPAVRLGHHRAGVLQHPGDWEEKSPFRGINPFCGIFFGGEEKGWSSISAGQAGGLGCCSHSQDSF